jgi:tRNA G18 (ribose-2'-O)-methylase SpoU
MIVRQACIMGCKEVVVCGRKHYDKRFTVGAHNYINTVYWETPLNVCIQTVSPGVYKETINYNVDEFIKHCDNYTPVFLEQGGKDIQEISWKLIENPLIILGNESLGIPSNFIKSVKQKIPQTLIVSLPQNSIMRSMNVAIAGSIAMWEISKILK